MTYCARNVMWWVCVFCFFLARCAHCAVTFLSSLGDQSSPSLSTSVSVWNKVEPNLFHSVTESNIINNILSNISPGPTSLAVGSSGTHAQKIQRGHQPEYMCVMPILQVPRDLILYLGALWISYEYSILDWLVLVVEAVSIWLQTDRQLN